MNYLYQITNVDILEKKRLCCQEYSISEQEPDIAEQEPKNFFEQSVEEHFLLHSPCSMKSVQYYGRVRVPDVYALKEQ